MGEELYSKTLECPVCENKFKSKKVKTSKLRVKKRDSDFMTYYKCENPIKYSVNVCPSCGYAAMNSRYKYLNSKNIEVVKQNITPKWKKREYSDRRSIDEAITCYKLAIACGQLLKFKKFEMGDMCIRIAWLNRLKEDKNNELRFLKLSLQSYEHAYTNERIPYDKMDEITLGYLIGELHRRIGNDEKALYWFGKIVSNRELKSKRRLDKLVREQWYLVKEKCKSVK